MKIIKELTIILSIYFIGELISKYLVHFIPGAVVGMILLLILLLIGKLKTQEIETTSNYLLTNLSFFFIPSAVGLMTVLDIVYKNALPILIIMLISSVVVVVTTGLTVQFLKKVMKI